MTLRSLIRALTVITLLLSVKVLASPIDTFTFDSEANHHRFKTLTNELRCPICEGQSIGDSNAPISKDLRTLVYKQIKAGKTDQQIIDFMVDRYGEFILYRPQTTGNTRWLWYGPVAFGVGGLLVLGFVVARSRKNKRSAKATDIDDASLAQVRELLHGNEKGGRHG